MSLLPGVGTVEYNGYSFNGSLKSRISARFVYDQADRTVVYVVYTLDLTVLIVNSGSSTDTPMDDLRNRLSTPGRCLKFSTTGLGTMNVQCTLAGALDVVWGPKPRILDMESIGSSQAWRVRWVCEVAIPQCSAPAYRNFPLAFNYEMQYAIEENGLTTRTYTGYVELALGRETGGSRFVVDEADRFREQINPPLIPGFRRKPGDFRLSADRRILKFTIVDTEMTPDGIPAYCTNASGTHSIRTADDNSFTILGTIQAEYTVNPKEPKTRAWEVFYLLMVDRLNVARFFPNLPDSEFDRTERGFRITHIELEEGLYSNALTMRFAAHYYYVGTAETLLTGSGMWRPMVGTQWLDYAKTVQNVIGPRGNANLFYNKMDDAILDICEPRSPRPPSSQTVVSLRRMPDISGSMTTRVTPNNSWAQLKTNILHEPDEGKSIMKSLPEEELKIIPSTMRGVGPMQDGQTPIKPPDDFPPPTVTEEDGTEHWFELPPGLENPGGEISGPVFKPSTPKPKNGTGLVVQQRTAPVHKVRLIGQAVRVGYPIPPPVLFTLLGCKCIPAPNDPPRFITGIIGNWFGYPIYGAAWDIPYVLEGQAKGESPVPVNPTCEGMYEFD